jgi:hypothetical protein
MVNRAHASLLDSQPSRILAIWLKELSATHLDALAA